MPTSTTTEEPPPGGNAYTHPDRTPSVQFPWKLHELLTKAETNGNDSIISWLPGTNAFKVHDKTLFASKILPAYFSATKYKSFQRNLNLWGFETITDMPNKGGSHHPLFVRANVEKCHYMSRHKVKKDSNGEKTPNKQEASKSLAALSELASRASAVHEPTQPTERRKDANTDPLVVSFARKLHFILSQSEYMGCMTWTQDGRCIRIVDPFRFQELVAPTYFSMASYTSFLVELEKYGFKKVNHAGHAECFYHDLMIRGLPHLCKYMSTPEQSRRFISENPAQDLASFEAGESLDTRLASRRGSDMSMPRATPHPLTTPSAASLPPSLLPPPTSHSSRGDALQHLLQQSEVLSLLSGAAAGASGTSSSSYQNSLAFAALAPQLQQFRQAHGLDSSAPVDSTSLALLAALRSTQK